MADQSAAAPDSTATCNEAGGSEIRCRKLGDSALMLTELGYGTAALGNLYAAIDDATASGVVEAAWSAGVRYFDTAPFYGFGLAERRLGDSLRARLDTPFVVSSKVGRRLEPLPRHQVAGLRHGFASDLPFEPVYDYSYSGIMRAYEASLQRLGLARIEILLVHDIGQATHGKDHEVHLRSLQKSGYRALEELRASGEVEAIGLGVNEWQVCEEAMQWGRFDCFLLAGRYTLLEQGALETFLPQCVSSNVALILGGIYNSGILATGTTSGGGGRYDYLPASEAIVQRVRRLERVCDAHGVPLAAAALQFPLAHPQVASVIPGAASAAEFQQSLRHYHTKIPDALWRDLKAEDLIAPDAPVPEAATS